MVIEPQHVGHDPAPEASTRDKLLRAAIQLFAAKGFDGTSVKDIVELADVNISLVSYHFNGKEGLFRSCLEQFGNTRLVAAERALRSPQNFAEFSFRLQLFVEEMLAAYLVDPDLSRIINRDMELANSIVRDVFEKSIVRIYELLVGFLDDAQASKTIILRGTPQMAASLLLGVITHITRIDALQKEYYGHSLQDEAYFRGTVDYVMNMITKGICNPAPGASETERPIPAVKTTPKKAHKKSKKRKI